MLRRLNGLISWGVKATDGDIGRVVDFLMDDERWTVRYLVVDPGGWLSLERVLVSPIAVDSLADDGERFCVRLTRTQVRESPPLESKVVPRRYEADYSAYYGYPHYWVGGGLWGMSAYPGALATGETLPPARADIERAAAQEQESHIKSVSEVTGYHIQAPDGEIGHVDDFLIDDRSWEVRYLLIDTSNWIGGKWVLVPPQWATRVDWLDAKIHVDVSREQIRSSPEFDPAQPLSPDDERRLKDHYGRGEPGPA
jgi:hypothetical protein